MKNLFVKTILMSVTTVALLAPAKVSAQQSCAPGTGGKGEPACVPCTQTPYGTCVPIHDTGLFDDLPEISPEVAVLTAGSFGLGVILLLNGKALNKKVTE